MSVAYEVLTVMKFCLAETKEKIPHLLTNLKDAFSELI